MIYTPQLTKVDGRQIRANFASAASARVVLIRSAPKAPRVVLYTIINSPNISGGSWPKKDAVSANSKPGPRPQSCLLL